jgi:hypothetical protein
VAAVACQRWSPGRVHSWRWPEDGGFDASRYGVVELHRDAEAKEFVTSLHYSGTYPSAIRRYGMYDLAECRLVGVAILSRPQNPVVLTSVFPDLQPKAESLDLGRFVLCDQVPANGESWFWAECRRLAAFAGLRGVVAFSDPVPRTRADGTVVMPGHIGTIYQASNGLYLGTAWARTHALLPTGQILSPVAAQKIRKQAQGHAYAERQLVDLGARPMRAGERPAAWLAEALNAVGARKLRHPGNHRYAWRLGISRRARAAVRIALEARQYPKADRCQLKELELFGETTHPGTPDDHSTGSSSADGNLVRARK